MRHLLAIAARNILRNTRRSVVSGAAIFVGVTAIIALKGFLNGFIKNAVEDAAFAKVGAIQVHKRGYENADRNLLDYDLPADGTLAARIAAVPGVKAVTSRISIEGMLSNGSVSSMFVATAIDPATEYQVCPKRRDNVAPGSKPLEAGAPGDTATSTDILIGSELAASLDARIGSTLTMTSAGKSGAQNALDVTVRGFLPSRMIVESKRLVTAPLALTQDLLRMPGRVTEYAIAVDDIDRVADVAARLQQLLGPEYLVEDWRTLMPAVRDRLAIQNVVLLVIMLILFLLVASGIANTMLMAVYERVREIGTMMAVGTRRWQVRVLFLAEAGFLGLGGGALGAAVGSALVLWAHRGVSFHPPGGDLMTVFPFVPIKFVLTTIGFAVVGTVAAGAFAAWRASKLSPVEALRAN